jgi:hypothetical protein
MVRVIKGRQLRDVVRDVGTVGSPVNAFSTTWAAAAIFSGRRHVASGRPVRDLAARSDGDWPATTVPATRIGAHTGRMAAAELPSTALPVERAARCLRDETDVVSSNAATPMMSPPIRQRQSTRPSRAIRQKKDPWRRRRHDRRARGSHSASIIVAPRQALSATLRATTRRSSVDTHTICRERRHRAPRSQIAAQMVTIGRAKASSDPAEVDTTSHPLSQTGRTRAVR